ncbi:hypothetical protein JZO86_03695 [Enterococcus ureasiticus]|nr:hypothetical protein [Enterococcus sp. DIV0849a]MBO0472813.1 hypothetical protein [Enterococcus ureasiticus]
MISLRDCILTSNKRGLAQLLSQERMLYNDTKLSSAKMNECLIRIHYAKMNNQNSEVSKYGKMIWSYIIKQDHWYHYDVFLFNNAIFAFTEDQVFLFSKKFLSKLPHFKKNIKTHYEGVLMYLNLIIFFLDKNEQNLSKLFIDEASNLVGNSEYFYEMNKLNFLKGIWEIKFADYENGLSVANSAIDLLNHFQQTKSACAHKLFLEEVLNSRK